MSQDAHTLYKRLLQIKQGIIHVEPNNRYMAQYDELAKSGKIVFLQTMMDGRHAYEVML